MGTGQRCSFYKDDFDYGLASRIQMVTPPTPTLHPPKCPGPDWLEPKIFGIDPSCLNPVWGKFCQGFLNELGRGMHHESD